MARKPKEETPVEETQAEAPKTEVAVEESEAKKNFRAYMADYKVNKPAKYAQKEAEFIKHLNSL